MKPIPFPGSNRTFTAPGCHDLPAYNDGQVTTICYQFTDDEIKHFIETKEMFFSIYAGQSTPPISVSLINPVPTSKDALMLIAYRHLISDKTVAIWNTVDADAPQLIPQACLTRANDIKPITCHIKEIKAGDYVIIVHPETGKRVLAFMKTDTEEELFEVDK